MKQPINNNNNNHNSNNVIDSTNSNDDNSRSNSLSNIISRHKNIFQQPKLFFMIKEKFHWFHRKEFRRIRMPAAV